MKKLLSFLMTTVMILVAVPNNTFATLVDANSNYVETTELVFVEEQNGQYGYSGIEGFYYFENGTIVCKSTDSKKEILTQYRAQKLKRMGNDIYAVVINAGGEEIEIAIDTAEDGELTLFSVTSSSNETIIYDFLKNTMGFNTAAACGILANIYKESSFNPGSSCLDVNGLTSYGICQWNGARFTALKNYCSSKGYNYTSLTGQLNYLKYELEGSEKYACSKIKNVDNNSTGAYNAGYNWARYFERCAQEYYAQRAVLARDTYWKSYSSDSATDSSASTVTKTYNADAAIAYAKNHWNDGKGLCAEFVSDCLTAGGINVNILNTRGLRNYLVNNGYANDYLITKQQGTRVKMSAYADKIAPGDVIINYCVQCNVYPHVMLVSGTNSSGQVTYYAHNSAANNKAYWNGSDGYPSHGNGTHTFHMYVLHIRNASSGGVSHVQPTHTHSYTTETDSAHPHNQFKRCSCGTTQSLGTSKSITCRQCYPLGNVKLTRSFEKTKGTAEFYRNSVENGNNYMLDIYYSSSENGTYRFYKSYDMSTTSKSISGLKSSYYYGKLTVKNTLTGEEKTAETIKFRIADTYNVTYNANGGKNAPSSQTKVEDTDLTLSSSIPNKEGHIFKGWASSKNAIEAQYQTGGRYTKNAKITLYAVWEPEIYTIKFDANGGKGTVEASSITYGDTMKMPNGIVKDYCYLKGWSSSKSAASAEYKFGQDYTFKSDTTLYAVWGQSTWGGEVSSALTGKGTKDNPYEIATAADLAYLANKVNSQTATPSYKYYKLTDNINLTYSEWVPIGVFGNENQYFYGSFDGNGFTISDLYITKTNEGSIGLFGYAKDSEIKNLTVTGAIESISSSSAINIGAIVGYSENTELSKLSVMYFNIGSITAGVNVYTHMGTVAGYINGGSIVKATSVDSHIDLKTGMFETGMIAGRCNADITNCSVNTVEGGLFSSATSVNAFRMGGLCGTLLKKAEKCTVEAPYLSNNVKTTSATSVGGLVGYLEGEAKVCTAKFSDKSVNSVTMSGTGTTEIGGIAGKTSRSAKITDCKFDGSSVSSTTSSGETSVGGIIGKAAAKSNPMINITGGQTLGRNLLPEKEGFVATWYTDSAFTTPYDFSKKITKNLTLYAKWEKKENYIWDGSSKEPYYDANSKTYLINTAEELAWISDVVDGRIISGSCFPANTTFSGYVVKLTDNIYLNDVSNIENWDTMPPENGWNGIGQYSSSSFEKAFSGTFDGNNYYVSGMYANVSGNLGLFTFSNGTVKNVTLVDSYIDHTVGGAAAAIVANNGDNGIVENCVNRSSLVANAGIVCNNEGGQIRYCVNYGTITNHNATSRVAGIVANNSTSSSVSGEVIEHCVNYGNIIADSPYYVGGISAYGYADSIMYCYNAGDITVKAVERDAKSVHGVGTADEIKCCYNIGNITVNCGTSISGIGEAITLSYCYNRGNLKSAGNGTVGGITSKVNYFGKERTIKSCYNTGSISSDNLGGSIAASLWGEEYEYYNAANYYVKYCYSNKTPLYNLTGTGEKYRNISNVTYKSSTDLKNISNLTGFSTTYWSTDTYINSGYPYLKSMVESYETYTVTAVADTDTTSINRSFANIDGILSGTASNNSNVGGVIGYGDGSTGEASTANNMITIADGISATTSGSSYKAYSGNIIGRNSGSVFNFNNAYYNSEMSAESSSNTIDTTGVARSKKTINVAFLTNVLGLKQYSSLENLNNDSSAVWVLKNGELPELYYNCLNDVKISEDIKNGTIAVDKTQAVDGETVTITATPNENYILNKIYVNGDENVVVGGKFDVSGDSIIYATFSEKIPEYQVSIEENRNASCMLNNEDAGNIELMSLYGNSGSSSIIANDGEEISVIASANQDYAIDNMYVNGEEIAGDSFILEANSIVTMEVTNISTNYNAVTNDAENVEIYTATLSGSIDEFENASRYILYWKSDNPAEVFVTEVQDGYGIYSVDIIGLESNTEYSYQMTENGEIKTFTTLADAEDADGFGGDTPASKDFITSFTVKNYGANALISVDVENVPNGAKLCIASYNSRGKLIEIQMPVLSNGEASAIFSTNNVRYYKAFIWDDNINPLSLSKESTIN